MKKIYEQVSAKNTYQAANNTYFAAMNYTFWILLHFVE